MSFNGSEQCQTCWHNFAAHHVKDGDCYDCRYKKQLSTMQQSGIPVNDPRPRVDKWELHTWGGKPVLVMQTSGGERVYHSGTPVTHEDFCQAGRKFRGVVSKSTVQWSSELSCFTAYYEIILTQHAMIDSGEYKPRTVAKSSQPTGLPINKIKLAPVPVAASLPQSSSLAANIPAPAPGVRKFDFTE